MQMTGYLLDFCGLMPDSAMFLVDSDKGLHTCVGCNRTAPQLVDSFGNERFGATY